MNQNPVIAYISTNWPMVVFFIGAAWGFLVWMKKQLLDNVYATKLELHKTAEELEEKMAIHEKHDAVRYTELRQVISDNHDEVKSLIIRVLDK
jgi:hypothetical protein